MSALPALLVAVGAALLWPVLLARHGRGIALSALLALVFGTVAYGLARSPSWEGAAAFAAVSALVRLAWGRADAEDARLRIPLRTLWILALAAAVAACWARDAGVFDVLDGLFSSWRGLLFWSPVLWLGFVGAFRARRGAAAALGPILLLTAAVAAVGTDFGPYRGARFAPILPLLALGLARAFDGIRSFALHHPLVPVAAGIAALAGWNALLMAQYRDGRIPRDDTVSFPRVARNAAVMVSSAAGTPTAWPANWLFAARHRVSAARYDVLSGVDLFGPRGLGGVIDIGHLPTDEALLQRGWSVRHPCGIGICRAVEGTAELLAPIGDPVEVHLVVSAAGGGALTVALNGTRVLEAPLTDDVRPHVVRLPRGRFRRGLNAFVFTVAPGGRALVDRIVFAPAPSASAGAGAP